VICTIYIHSFPYYIIIVVIESASVVHERERDGGRLEFFLWPVGW
jgi:hypothetical protein